MKRGNQLLKDMLAPHGAQAAFVREFNEGYEGSKVDAPMVSRWCNGRMPSPEHMARIEDLKEIPMRAWTEDTEQGAA